MRVKWDDIFDNPDLLKEFVVPTYKIPKNILNRIPDHFWACFAGVLCAFYGPDIFKKDEDGFYNIIYVSGTGSWTVALKTSCKQIGIDWLISYYTSLSWDESDLFDDELSELLIKKFIENDDMVDYKNIYYKWIINNDRKD